MEREHIYLSAVQRVQKTDLPPPVDSTANIGSLEKLANQTHLWGFVVCNEAIMPLFHSEVTRSLILTERSKSFYMERVLFWAERQIRQQIINLQTGNVSQKPLDSQLLLSQMEDFYKETFIKKNPVEALFHKMLDADKIESHSHEESDIPLTLQVPQNFPSYIVNP